MRSKRVGGPILWPIVLIGGGLLLLIDNFLLLEGFNAVNLWPLLLVIAGIQILLRGDFTISDAARTFGITRGSVEAGTLEINSGIVDVNIRPLPEGQERLIAGQYAPHARPSLQVDGVHAHLKMARAQTRWYDFADWALSLTQDMPWRILISTNLGQVDIDLSELILEDAVIATGLGDIQLVCPLEAFAPIQVCSHLGNIHIITPHGYRATIHTEAGRFVRVHHNPERYETLLPDVYSSIEADEDAPPIEIHVHTTFGNIYLG